MNIEELVDKIARESGTKKEEVMKLVKEKEEELSGLISPEGAAYIVASELGVKILRERERSLKIKNIVGGMSKIDIVAKVVRVDSIREYERNGKKGRFVSIFLGDETGVIRMPLWNEECRLVEDGKIKEGDVIKLTNVFSRESGGMVELRLGSRGKIEKLKDISIDVKNISMEQKTAQYVPSFISDIVDEGNYEVSAAIVHVFKKNPFFYVCPECGAKLEESDGKWNCPEHGDVKPKKRLVISCIIDDGTANMRAVFFGEAAKNLLHMDDEKIEEADENGIYDSIEIGKDMIFKGRVRLSSFSNEHEMIVNEVGEIDINERYNELMEKIKNLKG